MASESFRIHLHASGVQHTLSPPAHSALRLTAVPDEEWDNGFTLSGSNDNLNWTVLKTVVAPASNEVVESPWLFLRVEGVGTSFGDPRNALVTVEYLDAEEATLALDTGEVTITNTPLEVTGEVTAATPSDALLRETHQISLLEDILIELKKQTDILEEMSL